MPVIELHITFDTDTGQIGVSGPIQDKIGVLGILAEATYRVHKWHEQQRENRIQPATLIPGGLTIPGS